MMTNVCIPRTHAKGSFPCLGLGLILVAALMTGCSGDKPDKIILRGSNTVGEELAPRLIAEFQKDHPHVSFDLEFKGSTYGFGALMVGRCDIAAASREVTANELDMAKSRNVAFNEHIIGAYSVAVIVHPANPVSNLTLEQVRGLFTGAIQNWKDVGGRDAPVRLHIRDPISGTYLGFQELAMDKQPYAFGVVAHTNYLDIVRAVSREENGIGYVSMAQAASPGVKSVSIGGVVPSADAVRQGRFPFARVLRLYTDKAQESAVARDFIQLVQSARGQEILAEMGFVPRP